MAKPTAAQIADHEAKTLYCQLISYDRSKGFCGFLYEGKKPVQRALLVVKSDQESSVMVQQGRPYIVYITGNEQFATTGEFYSEFFSTPEEALAFAHKEAKCHKLIGEATGTHV